LKKNPLSISYLKENLRLNKITSDKVKVLFGDNRCVGNEECQRKGDRILMGYFPTPKNFLQRAFEFLKDNGGIIHYHFIAHKNEFQSLVKDNFEEEITIWNNKKRLFFPQVQQEEIKLWEFSCKDFRIVKCYAPQLYHCVTDVHIF